MKYFGAIDQGTTSSRFIVFDETGSIVNKCLELDINYGHLEDQIKEMKAFYETRKTS